MLAVAAWAYPCQSASLKLIGIAKVAPDAKAGGWQIGGLSGIDYDAAHDRWYVESDDKSEYGPSRFYVVALPYDGNGIGMPEFTATLPIQTPDGARFPESGHGGESLDTESIRLDPKSGGLVMSSEGDPRDGFGPAIRRIDRRGRVLSKLALPPLFAFDATGRTGPRPNRSLEGLTFTPDGAGLWASMEAPFFQDAPFPSLESGAPVRFTLFGAADSVARQYVYNVDPLLPQSAGRLSDNGVSEILAVDDRHLLVLERSGIKQDDGDFHFFVRLYCTSADGATDVSGLGGLAGRTYQAMRKRLVFNFATLTDPVSDNVEGMTWGRPLANGDRSLVFVTDNNFSARHDSQFEAFDVLRSNKGRSLARALGCP